MVEPRVREYRNEWTDLSQDDWLEFQYGEVRREMSLDAPTTSN